MKNHPTKPIENQIKRRKWNWFGHILHEEVGAIEKTALDWNPQGHRRRGRLNRMWQRTTEDEIRGTGRLRNEVKGIAMPGSSSWMPYAPQGVKGLDDDDNLLPRLKMGNAVHSPLQIFMNIQGQLDCYLYNGLVLRDLIGVKFSEFSAILSLKSYIINLNRALCTCWFVTYFNENQMKMCGQQWQE